MIKVLLADRLSQKALDLLGEIPEFEIVSKVDLEPNQLKEELRTVDAVVIRGTILDRELLESAENLSIIVRAGIDLDNIDIQYARSRRIEVRNTPHSASITVAEYTLAQMLNINRFLGPAHASLKSGKWEKERFMYGAELFGKTAGIIGFGRIGKEVAKRLLAMGMKVVFYDTQTIKSELDTRPVPLEELLKTSDFISIHVPLTGDTKNLISTGEFNRMKNSAVLINTARTGVVDETAMLEALNDGKLKAAAIDVWESELTEKQALVRHEKVFPTPYLVTCTLEGEARAGEDVLSVLKEFFNV